MDRSLERTPRTHDPLQELPATISKREEKEGGAYVTLEDLCRIVDWKLQYGKFRCVWGEARCPEPACEARWATPHS